MKFNLLVCFLLLNIASFSQTTFFIKYKSTVSKEEVASKITSGEIFSSSDKLFSKEQIKVSPFAKGIARTNEIFGRILKVTFPEDISVSAILRLGSSDPQVDYIEPMVIYQIDYIPNDTLSGQQWALQKIKAYEAWDITAGSDTVLLGIIDTGIDYLHPDLKNKIYINTGETGTDNNGNDKRFNGIDDDGNEFIDDYMGWDFTDRVGFPFDSTGGDYLGWDNDPLDQQGHGTYIAGIAGAETNNTTGVAGTAPNLKMINLRAFDPGGYGEEDDVAAAILYAVEMGVKVINMSFGDYSFSYTLRDVIQYAYSKNVVMVASAGNSSSADPHYPSAYPEVISVGNSTQDDFVAGSSNYGSTIDLVAPGSVIMTTARNNNYAMISGTSASAPFVSASAGLILSLNNFTNEEVRQILKSTSDDIGTPGWDIKSGAGRLNLLRALSINAPSQIKINYPRQDFATFQDTLNITATVLSPYFTSYQLFYGTGLNPAAWTTLIPEGLNQISGDKIYTLQLAQLPDTVYCLRLLVHFNNGRTMEERSNFYLMRTAPEIQLVTLAPMLYGEKTTIVASVYTNMPSVVKLYYKKANAQDYNYVTLDGFNMNTKFVKQYHYGFVPVDLIEQNSQYVVKIEAENLAGVSTTIVPAATIFTNYPADYGTAYLQAYKLPPGLIYEKPVNFIRNEFNEVLFSEFYPTQDLWYSLYKLDVDTLVKIDSVKDRIPRDVGDFNKNGKTDLLGTIERKGFIDEQSTAGSFDLVTKFSDSTTFWAASAEDIDKDGTTEVFAMTSDTVISVFDITSDLQVQNEIKLPNFTLEGLGGNVLDYPRVTITDLDNNGFNEIWAVDRDGDIFNYELTSNGSYVKGNIIRTDFASSTAFLDAGDFDGDGKKELAVLLRSIEELDIAPFYRLLIFNLQNNQINYKMDQAFIDASTEFRSGFQRASNSIRFYDLDNNGSDELLLFVYPYAYIFRQGSSGPEIVHYSENINSNTIFVGDLNKNNVPEVAFPDNSGIHFYEFNISNKAAAPYHLAGYSIDSTVIKLSWEGSGAIYYIYRGTSPDSLTLRDSLFNSEREYTDIGVTKNVEYYYAVQSIDLNKPDPISELSKIIKVYSHAPSRVIKVTASSSKTITVTFSDRISTTIENLEAFLVQGSGYPNSISPQSQYSYLLSFSSVLPAGQNRILVNGLRDYYGSPVPAYDSTFNVNPAVFEEQFFISTYELLNPYLIKIVFNLDVDSSSVVDRNNYIFSPANSVTSVSIDQADKKIIYLDLKGSKPVGSIGKEYRLQLKNVASLSGININTGAGSYIVIAGFAKDLSDVYVYPNPVRGGEMTFANLPQFAKITIFTLDGKQISTLEENDGNGGVQYNLIDNDGKQLASGIYVYRVVQLDDAGNEKEDKVGKFAVVR